MADAGQAGAPGLTAADEAAFDELLVGTGGNAAVGAPAPVPAPAEHSVPHVADHSPHGHETPPAWDEFTAGWDLGLYQDAVTCAVFAGLVLGVLGVFIVLRRAVFVTAAVSQSAALGVALAFYLQIHASVSIPPALSAFALSLLAPALLTWRTERHHLPRETVLGLTYIAASAAAVLVGDRITQEAHDIAGILFGTAVLVRPGDLLAVEVVGVLVLLTLAGAFRGLVFAGFDPEGARVQGVPVRSLEILLWVLVALEVSVATRAIGALPVFAFAVLPAMTGLALAERLRWVLVIAAVVGAAAGGLGYLFAFFQEFPVGASQAAVATLCFVLAAPAMRLRRGRVG